MPPVGLFWNQADLKSFFFGMIFRNLGLSSRDHHTKKHLKTFELDPWHNNDGDDKGFITFYFLMPIPGMMHIAH